MSVVTVHEAKARLSELIEKTLRGEEVIIARRNTPLVRLVPFADKPGKRKIGTAKGRLRIHDDFDRLIIAQSLTERIAVISSDRSWTDYGVTNLF